MNDMGHPSNRHAFYNSFSPGKGGTLSRGTLSHGEMASSAGVFDWNRLGSAKQLDTDQF